MDAAKKLAEKHNLQDLVPLNALSDARFAEVSRKIVVEEVKKGCYLFRKGDRDNQSIFLLDGSIILIDGHRKVTGEVQAGTDISRYPIANQQPRALSARAVSKVVIARIDSGLLDVFLTWDQTSSTEATEIKAEDNEDWMTQMLQSEAFIKIPPAMIQRLLIKMQSYQARKGEVVIRQGDDGDFFYTIHKGSCVVTRTTEDGEEVKLAELCGGDCFGEESLISDAKRNATVTMTTDGMLMCLAKKDFVELLQKPLVRDVAYEEAVGMIDEGAVWLDVRSTGEYENSAFEDSVNIPLSELRGEMPELVYNAKYVICCDTGRRSASAAFILSHKGFEVYVLDGGMNSLTSETVEDEAPQPGAVSVADDESVKQADIIDFTEKQGDVPEPEMVALQQGEAGQELLAEIEKLRSELAGSEEAVSDLRQEVVRLNEQETLLREQYVTLQEEYDERLQPTGRELEQAQSESVDLEKQRESSLFEHNQEDWLQRVNALEGRLAELSRDHKAVLAERDAGREQLTRLQTAAESALKEQQEVQAARGSEIGVLQAELESTGRERERLNVELDDERRRVADLQQSLDALREEKQDVEQQASVRVAGEQEASSRLQAELDALGQHMEQLDAELESERQRAASLQQQLDAQLAGHEAETANQQEHTQQLQAALDAAESEKQEIQAQLEALQAAQAEEREQRDKDTEQAEHASQEIAGLQQEIEALRNEKRQLEISQGEQIENAVVARQAAEEALQRQQQERDEEHAAQQLEIGVLKNTLAELQMQLEKAYENATRDQARLEGEFSDRNEKLLDQIDQLESRHVELKQEREQLQDELQQVQQGRDEIQRQLESAQQQAGELQQEVTSLSSLASEAKAEANGLREQLAEGAAGSEDLRARLAQQEEIAGQLRGEVETQAQQLETMQLELQQAQENARVIELESEESLRKAWDDLNRKNDAEKELQGQITRLRKKLEQSADDLQQIREEAREAATQARDALHAERKERSDERAQMAARQRELKEQMVALAGQHEALQTNQKGVLAQAENAARNDERARLKEVLETHAQAEDQLAAMRRELAQAREETERAVREERERYTADLEFARAQKVELDTIVAEQESRLQALTGERDGAVAEQQSIREQLNTLRAEVEISRGLINANGSGAVEDPVRLRAELEEARRNLDIAIRVRSEAESARDRAIAERNAMQQGVAVSDDMPLSIPSLDEQEATRPASRSTLTAGGRVPDGIDDGKDRTVAAALAAARTQSKPRLGKAAGFVAVVLALLASWFMYEKRETGIDDPANVPVETAGTLPVDAGDQAKVEMPVQASSTAMENLTAEPDSPPVVAKARPQAETVKPPVVTRARPQSESAQPAMAAVATEPVQLTKPVDKPAAPPEITPVVAGRSFSDTLKGGSRGPELVELPAATYLMGSSGASPKFEERPRHAVSLPAFAIGKHEVTFAEYDRFARATGRRLPYDEGWGRGARPVINVSWKDATAYAAWLSKQTGHTYRLPTESQWEFAARGGTGTPHWWPQEIEETPANCFDCGSEWDGKMTAAVGSFPPNGFGLHDTAGNVQEWTRDCYQNSYKGAPSDGTAWQSKGCTQRVVRGGGYTSPLGSLRSARRAQLDQETRLDNLGFRVVRIK